MSNKASIEKSLKSLILNDDKEFVAMLSGEWGVGKTYFWNNLFTEKELKKSNIAYISLFGYSSLQSIKNDIVMKLSNTEKGKAVIAEIFNNFRTSIGARDGDESSGLSLGGSLVSSALSAIPEKSLVGTVICFDDFERLSHKVSLKDVMGLISQFKEQKKCKIVMILNEGELSEDDQKVFAEGKEKIVDYSFNYKPSQEELFEAIKEDIKKIKFCKNEWIYDFFKKIDLNNIRIMKQAIYQLNHFSFIAKYKFDDKVVKEFVEIALNLFIFRAKCNLPYESYKEMIKYKSKNSWDKIIKKTEEKEIAINDKYEKCYTHYTAITYSSSKDNLVKTIYYFIENHSIAKRKIINLLNLSQSTLYRYTIQNKLDVLNIKIHSDFNSNLKDCTNEIFELLNTNKEYIPHILDIGDLHYYINLINEHSALTIKEFIDDVIKSYIDIKPEGKRFSFSFERYKTFLEEHYPHLIAYLEDAKNEQFIEKINITDIQKLLDKVSSGYSSEDTYILNNLSSNIYKQHIYESAEFYDTISDFLSRHKNTQDFNGAVQNIKKSLIDLKQKNNDNAWRINKLLKKVDMKLED